MADFSVFHLQVYVTMYLNDVQRTAFYEGIGLNTRDFDMHVIVEVGCSAFWNHCVSVYNVVPSPVNLICRWWGRICSMIYGVFLVLVLFIPRLGFELPISNCDRKTCHFLAQR